MYNVLKSEYVIQLILWRLGELAGTNEQKLYLKHRACSIIVAAQLFGQQLVQQLIALEMKLLSRESDKVSPSLMALQQVPDHPVSTSPESGSSFRSSLASGCPGGG